MKNATRTALLEALDRLIAGEPRNQDLRKKSQSGKLKINNSTVEKEAGKSVGALRNHKDIMVLINEKSLDVKVADSDTARTQVEVLQIELKVAKEYGTKQAKLKKKHHEKAKRDEEAMSIQAANQVKMIEQLMLMIPIQNREVAMDKIVSTGGVSSIFKNKFK